MHTCHYTTNNGNQCKRKATSLGFCWQHAGYGQHGGNSCNVGEEWDKMLKKCTIVSCKSAKACKKGYKCVNNNNIRCIRAPCPHYGCEKV